MLYNWGKSWNGCAVFFVKNIAKMGVGMMKRPFLLMIIYLLLASGLCKAQIYYVNTNSIGGDGTTQALTGPNAAWNAINQITGLLPGDRVLFNRGDTWAGATFIIPTSGTAGNHIIYGAYGTGLAPLIDVSANTSDAYGIYCNNKSYVAIEDFRVKGSGGSACVRIAGDSGAGDYGVIINRVEVIDNHGSSSGIDKHPDGFSQAGSSEVIYNDIIAAKCYDISAANGDGQCHTLHNTSKSKMYTADFTTSKMGIANTLGTTSYYEDVTIHAMNGPAIAAIGGVIDFNDSLITANSGGAVVSAGIGLADTYEGALIRNSTITISDSDRGYIKSGRIRFENCMFDVNSNNAKIYLFETGAVDFNNCTFNITAAGYLWRFGAAVGNAARSTFTNNVFKITGDSYAPFYVDDNGQGYIFENNTIYSTATISATYGFFEIKHSGDETGNDQCLIRNNIFYGVDYIAQEHSGITSYND
jgi:hypothetical protein